MEILLLLFVIALGIAVIGVAVYHGTRRGEDCHGYPYNCRPAVMLPSALSR